MPITAAQASAEPVDSDSDLLSPIEAVLRNQVLDRHALVLDGDYFEILGISPDATREDIEHARASLLATFSSTSESTSTSGFTLSEELVRGLAVQLEDIRTVVEEAARLLANDALRAQYRARRPPPREDSGER